MAEQVRDVVLLASEQVVDAQHFVALVNQAVDQVRAKEARPAGHQHPLLTEIVPRHALLALQSASGGAIAA
jgi:hypothetical protein